MNWPESQLAGLLHTEDEVPQTAAPSANHCAKMRSRGNCEILDAEFAQLIAVEF